MALYSWSRLYGKPASTIVTPQAMQTYQKVARDCIEDIPEFLAIDKAEKPLDRVKFLKADATKVEPWRSIMLKNSPGQRPQGAPVFIAQGTADTTIRPRITKQYAQALCRKGTRVSYNVLPGVTHVFAAKDSARATLAWIDDRFRGAPAPSICRR